MRETENGYCKCCVFYFKRENPTLIEEGSEEEFSYQVSGMCRLCYVEENKAEFLARNINE